MKKLIFLITLNALFLITDSFSFGQNRTIDSLLTLLTADKPDTNKVNHLNNLCREYGNIRKIDTALRTGNEALALAQKLNFKKGIASSYQEMGTAYLYQTNYNKALENWHEALKIVEELKNKRAMPFLLGNIGFVYNNQGNYPKALDYHLKALKVAEEIGNKRGIASILSNIGEAYFNQADYRKSLDYFFKSLKIAEKIGNQYNLSTALCNIGEVYLIQKNYPKACDYYLKGLKAAQELGDKNIIAIAFSMLGGVFDEQKDYSKALDYYFKALNMAEKGGDKNIIANTQSFIGSLYLKIGKFKESEQYLKSAIAMDDSIGASDGLRQTEKSLSELYDTIGRYKEALIFYKKSIALKDSIYSQENKKQLIRKEMNFEFDKKEAATKAEHDKEMAVAEAEKKKQQIVIWSVIGGLFLVIVFAGFVYRSLRITRKQKSIIELQKNEVDKQKEIVEKQKEKIVESITYSQRIQQSILMEESEVQNYLPECFIYFQPKDIVSGDFYWCSKTDDKIIIAAVDCTGHGVPGAFMSMIGNTLLNQIVNEKHITKPSEILHYLNLGVYEALHQKKDGALSDDGMDIALCTIDYKNNEIQYAGQNPLYILSDGKIEVIKGDIYSIGGGGMIAKIHDPLKKVFANHVIPIKKGMSIYLSTDGYMDQFGGSDRKKYGAQRFKDLLSNNLHLNMQQQKELMVSAHAEWKGNTPQIDDVLVIGIRL